MSGEDRVGGAGADADADRLAGDRPPSGVDAASPSARAGPPSASAGPPAPERRPWLERLGLAAIAVVMGGLFALVAVAAGAGGEWILAAMSAVGALMTLGVGLSTLVRG
jgi:hypothetical protein